MMKRKQILTIISTMAILSIFSTNLAASFESSFKFSINNVYKYDQHIHFYLMKMAYGKDDRGKIVNANIYDLKLKKDDGTILCDTSDVEYFEKKVSSIIVIKSGETVNFELSYKRSSLAGHVIYPKILSVADYRDAEIAFFEIFANLKIGTLEETYKYDCLRLSDIDKNIIRIAECYSYDLVPRVGAFDKTEDYWSMPLELHYEGWLL